MVSLKSIKWLLRKYGNKLRCFGCGKPLMWGTYDVKYYEHSGGIYVDELQKKVWVYALHRCGYGNSLNKLLRQLILLGVKVKLSDA